MSETNFSQSISIDGREVGPGCPVYIIAEAGVAHFGSVEKALRLVDLAREAGADAVKFQLFRTEVLISGINQEWRDRLKPKELPPEAFYDIAAYCREKGITFLATAHDEPSLDDLDQLGVPAYKVGSGEVDNWPFIERVCERGQPVIISTGMYDLEQVGLALEAAERAGNPDIALLHCSTMYPTPPELVNLSAMATMRREYATVCGYSDHTEGFHIPLAAAALGADILEKHISLDFNVPNAQDWKVSCGPHDLADFIRQAREVRAGLGNGKKKPSRRELGSKVWAAKSLVAARDLKAGTVLSKDMLTAKRPGEGIAPNRIEEVLGRKLLQGLAEDGQLRWEILE